MKTGTVIIGGGLSGLYTAHVLAGRGVDTVVLEARDRLGGRILSPRTADEAGQDEVSAVDMGPSWFWPHQHRMLALIRELGLDQFVYPQSSNGSAVMEYPDGRIVTGEGTASMAGAYRLSGGLKRLIDSLAEGLAAETVFTEAVVSAITRTDSGVTVTAKLAGVEQLIECEQVVIAMPPRVAANTLVFEPALSENYITTLRSVPTWMAGQAKFVASYDKPFWHQRGLSGDGLSHTGPLVEIHDASPMSGGPYALFGFVGVPAAQREVHAEAIKELALAQLVRMFGEDAGHPLSTYYKDWAFDSFTSMELDRDGRQPHPSGEISLISYWDKKILWAGTETAGSAEQANGYLEGALETGDRVMQFLA